MVMVLCLSGSQETENVELRVEISLSAFGSHIRYILSLVLRLHSDYRYT